MQQGLFDLEILDYQPTDASAHLKKIGFDSAGNQYAIKRIDDGNWIPLSEWIGYSLSQKVGIATPVFAIGYDDKRSPVFCSRWEDGKIFVKGDSRIDVLAELSTRLQAILNIVVLDEFIENLDRHSGNLIFKETMPSVLSFDFSLVQLTKSACNADIDLSRRDNTNALKRLILQLAKQQRVRLDTLETRAKIKSIPHQAIEKILVEAPEYWLQQAGIDCIIEYLSDKQKRL